MMSDLIVDAHDVVESESHPASLSDPPKSPNEAVSTNMAKVQLLVYFVSTVMRDARERYTLQQKLLYTLLIASRKLRHYFQGHPIKVITDQPLEQVIRNPNGTGRVAE
jgi:hypothetical protein